MLETNEIIEIISSSIRSAVCIDDEYPEPYQEIPEESKLQKQAPKILYQSFRENGKCDLDIYNFKGYESFKQAKEYLFSNKELLILDWELQPETQVKYDDSLKILLDAVHNDFIQFAAIYTQEPDTQAIAYKIYSFFYSTSTKEEKAKRYEMYSSTINDFLIRKECDCTVDDLEKIIKEDLPGYTLYPDKQKVIKTDIVRKIQQLIKSVWSEFCPIFDSLKMSVHDFLIWYENYINDLPSLREGNENFFIKPITKIGLPGLLINNTIIFILEKQQIGTNKGITPDKLYQQTCEIISKIPNAKSLLLALRLKEILYRKLAVLGKGLGGIDEEALTYHANNYEENTGENKFEYLVSCLSAHVTQHIIENIKLNELEKIFSEKSPKPSKEKLAALNSFLTFTKANSVPNHQIKPGDIFQLQEPVTRKGKPEPYIEYIICVSQSCDCLRPAEKLSYNFSFTGGKTTELDIAVRNVETDHFSFINDNKAIQWNLKLFTIYIEQYIFDTNMPLPVIINGQANELVYIGNQKEIFTQRLINATFNIALRMGIDLPHYK